MEEIRRPERLRKGDRIAIVSPASSVKEEYVAGAMEEIRRRGYEPVMLPHTLGPEDGNFASTRSERIMDLVDALEDESVKAILCARGGYGCCQLLGHLYPGLVTHNPKWLIGFSDISALHALWNRCGIASIHGPMAKHLATEGGNDPCTAALFDVLENGGEFDYKFEPHEHNLPGVAEGELRGGNFAVLNDLVNTPYDILTVRDGEEVILFLEDVGESVSRVNRMLWQLEYNGTLSRVNGLIFGDFTEYHPDKKYARMEDMIRDFIKKSSLRDGTPVVFGFPTGHTERNYPLVEGSRVKLEVGESVRLRTL